MEKLIIDSTQWFSAEGHGGVVFCDSYNKLYSVLAIYLREHGVPEHILDQIEIGPFNAANPKVENSDIKVFREIIKDYKVPDWVLKASAHDICHLMHREIMMDKPWIYRFFKERGVKIDWTDDQLLEVAGPQSDEASLRQVLEASFEVVISVVELPRKGNNSIHRYGAYITAIVDDATPDNRPPTAMITRFNKASAEDYLPIPVDVELALDALAIALTQQGYEVYYSCCERIYEQVESLNPWNKSKWGDMSPSLVPEIKLFAPNDTKRSRFAAVFPEDMKKFLYERNDASASVIG
tara:strand:+ start:8741 stop:9625 length:885 start_codon:yes stop_codon:yes gene_type:complete